MSFQEIESRFRQSNDTLKNAKTIATPYLGGHLTSFYERAGVEPQNFRRALQVSRIGSVYELPKGREINVWVRES